MVELYEYDEPETEVDDLDLPEDPFDVEDVDWRRAAFGMYADPGTVEIEPDAEVSLSESGAWVQAWVYVDLDDLGIYDDPEELQ
jgi:hypothetical protein